MSESSVWSSWWVVSNSLWPHGYSMPVHHQPLGFAQIHAHWVSDAIQPSLPLLSPPAFSISQHQGVFQWVNSLHQVAKVFELQLQHPSFQWIFRVNFLKDWLVWSPCLHSNGLSRVFSSTTIWKHQFFSTQPSLCFIMLPSKIVNPIKDKL